MTSKCLECARRTRPDYKVLNRAERNHKCDKSYFEPQDLHKWTGVCCDLSGAAASFLAGPDARAHQGYQCHSCHEAESMGSRAQGQSTRTRWSLTPGDRHQDHREEDHPAQPGDSREEMDVSRNLVYTPPSYRTPALETPGPTVVGFYPTPKDLTDDTSRRP